MRGRIAEEGHRAGWAPGATVFRCGNRLYPDGAVPDGAVVAGSGVKRTG